MLILFEEKHAGESAAAARWFNGLQQAVYGLQTYPNRCPLALESQKSGTSLRHLLYGKKPHVYRIIYAIDEVKKVVHILTIRHRAMEPADMKERTH